MAVIKCRMCGGDIEFKPGEAFGRCLFCDSLFTLPEAEGKQASDSCPETPESIPVPAQEAEPKKSANQKTSLWKRIARHPIPFILAAAAVFAVLLIGIVLPMRSPDIEIGGYVSFGRYPQSGITAKSEPIEWLVLEKRENSALLLSRYALDAKPYNEDFESTTWEKCSLRRWLNNEFLETAFSEKERQAILLTALNNSENQGYRECLTSGGKDTSDRIFLLNYADAVRYLGLTHNGYSKAAIVSPTAYAVINGAYASRSDPSSGGIPAANWWLRSPGYRQDMASAVTSIGGLQDYSVFYNPICVRPAIWVNTDSGAF